MDNKERNEEIARRQWDSWIVDSSKEEEDNDNQECQNSDN